MFACLHIGILLANKNAKNPEGFFVFITKEPRKKKLKGKLENKTAFQ